MDVKKRGQVVSKNERSLRLYGSPTNLIQGTDRSALMVRIILRHRHGGKSCLHSRSLGNRGEFIKHL